MIEHHIRDMIHPIEITFTEYPKDKVFVLSFVGNGAEATIALDKERLEELRLRISVTQSEAEEMERDYNNVDKHSNK